MREREMGKFDQKWKQVFDGAEMTPSENVWNAIDSKLWLSENTGFENGWRKLFNNAELTPANNVWKGIEASLASSENVTMKRRIFIYQRIAAVSIGLLIMFGAYSWFNKSDYSPKDLRHQNQSSQELNNTNSTTGHQSDLSSYNPADSTSENHQSKAPVEKSTTSVSKDYTHSNKSNINALTTKNTNNEPAFNNNSQPNNTSALSNNLIVADKRKNFRFSEGPIAELSLLNISKLPRSFKPNDYSIAYRLADARPAVMIKKKRESIHEGSFAAISFAAGSFSPGAGSAQAMDVANRGTYTGYSAMADSKSASISGVKNENLKPGTSFAMAINAGKRIFKRFILQGGVSYFNQNSSSTSQIVNVAPANEVATVNSFKPETTNSVTYQSQQVINSTFQFISVPVQVGYMIVDRKFGVQLNGGLAPDFFLGNSIYNEATQVETNGVSGEDGAFNTVSLAGLGSVEFSYKFFKHYRLSLAPGIKYSLTSIYNENTFASAKPLVADIGLRFRYIF